MNNFSFVLRMLLFAAVLSNSVVGSAQQQHQQQQQRQQQKQQQLRANHLLARDLADAKLVDSSHDVPAIQYFREEWQSIKHNTNKDSDDGELYDFARTVKAVVPHDSLPECSSGNEFLSSGGHWEKSDLVKDKYLYEGISTEKRPECREDWYNDPFVWAPNCSMPMILKNKETKRIKVALAGDSLTLQIHTATKHLPDIGIDFETMFGWNTMLTSIKYESDVCTQCDSKIHEKLYGLRIKLYTEEEFLEKLSGYDYIFYNEYAHYVGPFMTGANSLLATGEKRPLRIYYEEEAGGEGNVTTKEMMKDQISYFRRQIERKAELLRDHFPHTKVYYRTSPPHALKAVFPDIPKGELYPEPAREIPYQECEDHEDKVNTNVGSWCYSVINDLGREAFLSFGHQILETAAPMSQRTDAHPCSQGIGNTNVDCLHFCMPGPPNVMLAAIITEVFAREKDRLQSF